MKIPHANTKLQVTGDGRIFFRAADLSGVPVDPDEALAHIQQQQQRGELGAVDYTRVLDAVRAAKAQSGGGVAEVADAGTDTPVGRSMSARDDVMARRSATVAAAQKAIGQLTGARSERAALHEAHRMLVESAAPILGDRGVPGKDDLASAAKARTVAKADETVGAESAAAPAHADASADTFRTPPNAAVSMNAKREVVHVIDVADDRSIDDLKDQKAASKWLRSMASKVMHYQSHPATRPVLAAALVGPNGSGRKLAVQILARTLFDNHVVSAPRVYVVDLRRIIESGADLQAVVRHAKEGVVLIENADILDREQHHYELNIIEALAVAEGEPVLMVSGAPSLRGTLDADYRTRDTLATQVVFNAITPETLSDMFVAMAAKEHYTVDADAKKAALGRLRSWSNAGGDEVAALFQEAKDRLAERLYPDGRAPATPPTKEAVSTIAWAEVAPATFFDENGKLPVLERLEKRTGQERFKAWAEGFANRVVENQRKQASGEAVFESNNNIMLLGEKGTGKTTALEYINDLLYETGERNGKLTYVTASELIGATPDESAKRVQELYRRGAGGLISIDEAHILGKSEEGKAVLRALVPICLNESGRTTLALVGYPGPTMDLLDPEIDEGTARRFAEVNRVTLEVPTRDQLRTVLVDGIKKRGYIASDDVIDAAMNVMDVMMTQAGFGNNGAVRDLIDAAVTALANRKRTPETMNVLIASDFGRQPDTIENVVGRLDPFVGFEHLADALTKIGATIEDQRSKKRPVREAYQPFARIIGDTGSGRKTFATELTAIYRSFNLVSDETPSVVDVNALKGDVLGAAVTLTNQAVRRAATAGGHLVLHNLGGIADNPDQYARDVVSTLKSALRTHRDNIAVSLVGTEKEVAKFLGLDPALAALFNRRFNLNAMDADAASQVLVKKIGEMNYTLHAEADALLPQIMEHLRAQPNWQNGLDIEPLAQAVRDEHLSVRRQAQYADWEGDVVSSEALIKAIDAVIQGKGGTSWTDRDGEVPIPLPTSRIKPAAEKKLARGAR